MIWYDMIYNMFISYISDFALNDYYLALCRAISAFWLLFQCHPGHPNWTRNQACLFNASALHMKIKKSWISRLFFLSNTLIQKDVDCRDILSGVGLKSRSFCLQYGRNLSALHIFLRLSSSTRSENALVYWSTPVWDSCFHWIVATFGYGSIPIHTIFSGMNIHKSQLFWCSPEGYKVLTHCHLYKATGWDKDLHMDWLAILHRQALPAGDCHTAAVGFGQRSEVRWIISAMLWRVAICCHGQKMDSISKKRWIAINPFI